MPGVHKSCEFWGWSINTTDLVNKPCSLIIGPTKRGCDFKYVNLKHNLDIQILFIQVNIILEYMPEDLNDGK